MAYTVKQLAMMSGVIPVMVTGRGVDSGYDWPMMGDTTVGVFIGF